MQSEELDQEHFEMWPEISRPKPSKLRAVLFGACASEVAKRMPQLGTNTQAALLRSYRVGEAATLIQKTTCTDELVERLVSKLHSSWSLVQAKNSRSR
ncbi:hypothetical protein VNPA131289_56290 [Pseudomonas aeruginosa]|nr:hypothetical protein VNPA131289_56290 [Pseudomonas aeruginosa]GLF30912.1 hypothetical protein VNPA141486_55210 [Pseudomonas aeruginosa]